MEDFRRLIIMREDHSIALLFDLVDRLHIGREEGPFDRRDHVLHALIKMSRGAFHFRRPFENGLWQHAIALSCGRAQRPRRAFSETGHRPLQRGRHSHGALLMLTLSICVVVKITGFDPGDLQA